MEHLLKRGRGNGCFCDDCPFSPCGRIELQIECRFSVYTRVCQTCGVTLYHHANQMDPGVLPVHLAQNYSKCCTTYLHTQVQNYESTICRSL
jgi:hypothetical protein